MFFLLNLISLTFLTLITPKTNGQFAYSDFTDLYLPG